MAMLSLCAGGVADEQDDTAREQAGPSYVDAVAPIFERRCIACHGCLGSPCNVKLDSFAGVERGGFGLNAYSDHFGDYPRTDMDAAHGVAAWRKRGFYPILARGGSPQQNLSGSLLYGMVAAGMRHNSPGFDRDVLEGRRPIRHAAHCAPTPDALDAQLAEHPQVGMPFGLPAISEHDFKTLKAWVEAGSAGPSEAEREQAAKVANPDAVIAWERFFNDPSPRAQLVARFIFQHVYLATIVLEESSGDQFRLVRSKTPPTLSVDAAQGRSPKERPPVEVIGTGLPYDDPYTYAGIDRFWYRLQKLTAPPVQKNHFLWRLSQDDIAQLSALFAIDSGEGWDENADLNPSYGIESPFVQFAAIPAEARYRFIIENGEMLVGGITYGPVCNGQTATYAVKDQFWVVWLDPDHDPSVRDPLLSLDGPAALMDRSVFGNGEYIEAFARTKQRLFPDGWSLDAIWDGGNADGSQDNPNAWLTVLRHETNVSVLQGARGGMPRSLWLMSYAGFERMYYDTVAGFAYWEGDPKKLETLLFFNMVRQDFEDAFLSLLPRRYREHIRDSWTRGIGALGLAAIPFPGADQPTRIEIEGNEPLAAIVAQLADRLGPTISKLPDPLNPSHKPKVDLADPMPDFAAFERAFSTLTATDDQRFIRFLPSATVIRVNDGDKHRVYSLIVNRVYASQYTLIFQNGQALPSEDTISLYPTIVNGFPNLFVDLDLESAPGFITDLTAVETADAWARFERRYVILRNSEAFWPFYDWINAWNFAERGDAAGWLDLHYYDAPER